MKVSVVTIAWNDLNGLKKTIESVKSQNWLDVEHIVIDGGSTDGTAEFLRSATDIKWVSEKDAGRYDAMNKGARLATGKLIWFMHSSDIFHSVDSIKIVAQEFNAEPFSWGYGLSRIVKGDETIGIGGTVPFVYAKFVLGSGIIPHQAAVFERGFFWELGGYDIKFGLTADQLFMMKACLYSAPKTFADVLCDFDALGAGSVRGMKAHLKDTSDARRRLGLTASGSHVGDRILSTLVGALTFSDRVSRRLLKKLTPQPTAKGQR